MDESTALRLSDLWWERIWRDADVNAADELLADPFVRHSATGTEVSPRSEYKRMLHEFQRTLFKPATTIDDRVVSGDRVWTRATSRGVNRETGEPTVVTWLMVQRMTGERIAEHWLLTVRGVDWSA